MNPLPTHCSARSLTCGVAAYGIVRADAGALTQLRRQMPALPGEKLSLSLLKNADDQTVVALSAVLQAVGRMRYTAGMFRDWGAIAAPVMFGRDATHLALGRFRAEGAWGISPHMIPQHSLHAISGTISQVLHLHGPNFGVGGSHSSAFEAALVAASWIAEHRPRNFWLVLSAYEREKLPALTDEPSCCEALALACVADAAELEVRLSFEPDQNALEPLSLGGLCEELEARAYHQARWTLPGVGTIELESAGS